MRKLSLWTMPAILLVTLGSAVAVAATPGRRVSDTAPSPATESRWSWMNPVRWFSSKDKEKAGVANGKKDAKKEVAPVSQATPLPPAVDEARVRRAREDADLMRRLEVCDRLREIALRSEDHDLLRRVDVLSERAFAVYKQKTGTHTLAATTAPDDELRLLERAANTEAASGRRPGHEPIYSVTSDSASRRAAVKEIDR
jgi:hypothetical protein